MPVRRTRGREFRQVASSSAMRMSLWPRNEKEFTFLAGKELPIPAKNNEQCDRTNRRLDLRES